MKELTLLIPFVVPAVSITAALIVVSIAALNFLKSSYPRATAVVLALGVTIMALVGTAPIIFAPLAGDEVTEPRFSNGSALMLPFLTLAVSRLLCELLVAASGFATESGAHPEVTETNVVKTATPSVKKNESVPSKAKPRGRPKKQNAKEGQHGNQTVPVEGRQKLDQAATATKES